MSDITFSDAKQLVGCRAQLVKKDTEFDSKISLSFVTVKWIKKNHCCFKEWKNFIFKKIDKNVQFNSLFLGIPKIFLWVRVRQVAFLSEDWKKLSVWSSVVFTVSALEMIKIFIKLIKNNFLINFWNVWKNTNWPIVSFITFNLFL